MLCWVLKQPWCLILSVATKMEEFISFEEAKKGTIRMDLITIASVAALTAGVTSGLTEVAKTMITDAYQGLKNVITKKIGDKSHVITSIEGLEAKPQSVGRQQTLNEEIVDAHLTQDQDILHAAQSLLSLIKAEPGGERHIQQVTGNYNAIVQGSGNATVNVNQSNQH